jgi:UDP-glucose 4-epimerase
LAGRRVLITGVGSFMGAALARRLDQDPQFDYVAGLDTRPPRADLGRTEFIEADIRDPGIAAIVPAAAVDTLVHNQIVRRPGPGVSGATMHDVNVIGSLQLLTACEQTPQIRNIVVRGSAGIYGAEPQAPQFFTEDMDRLYPLRTRFQRDVAEIETLFATFARRHPDVVCTMLRYQPAIGPSLDTQVARYLSLPVAPTYLGFDPRLQLVHEDDALDALVAAVRRPVHGAVNVAGEGTIGLTRMLRMAGRPSLPVIGLAFGPVVDGMRRAGLTDLSPDFRRLLRYGRAVDTSRLAEEVGFRPQFTTEAAVSDYVARRRARDGTASKVAVAP